MRLSLVVFHIKNEKYWLLFLYNCCKALFYKALGIVPVPFKNGSSTGQKCSYVVTGPYNKNIINIRSTGLKNSEHLRIGTLIVLNNVTHVRMLENIRKDFVANVSHEIKTPLTAIKGFVETIIQIEAESPEDARRFLKIVMKHVDRLDAILEDLLSLARIEQKSFKHDVDTEKIRVEDIFETVLQVVQAKANEKKIELEYKINDNLFIETDEHLMEQALVNLVDNAVKYSSEETIVSMSATAEEGKLTISVADQGQGIPEKHLSRIFERFYRVDKARSRKLGGTGLGLAIVKHIVQAHSGTVSVHSTEGKGSTFNIHLPIKITIREKRNSS